MNDETERPIIKDEIVGTWLTIQEEDYNVYEFREDGSGLLWDSSGMSTDSFPLTYSFVEENRIEFSAQEGFSIFVDLSMIDQERLSWDAEVTGGYHIDFEKVGECELDELAACLEGRWIRFLPDNRYSLIEFNKSGEGIASPPGINGENQISFELVGGNLFLLKVDDLEPIMALITLPDNYKMDIEFPDEDVDPMNYYRQGIFDE